MQGFISRTLGAFGIPSFPWLWASSTLGLMGLMANALVMGWLVLELTDSAFWVGAASAAHGIGMLVFGVFAGVLMYLLIWTAHGLIYRWPATRLDEKALEDWLGEKGEWLAGLAGRLAGRLKKAS